MLQSAIRRRATVPSKQRRENSKSLRPHPYGSPSSTPEPLGRNKNQSRLVPMPLDPTKFEHRLDQLLADLKTAIQKIALKLLSHRDVKFLFVIQPIVSELGHQLIQV